jgi:nitroreductase
VRKREIKRTLADHAMLGTGNSYRVNDASAIAVFLSDLQVHKRLERIMELERKSGSRDPNYLATLPVVSTFLLGEGQLATMMKQFATNTLSSLKPMPSIDNIEAWSYKNTSLMAQTFVLAATSHGLATCMMEGFDARRVRQILRVPDRYGIPMMVATGYEYTDNTNTNQQQTPRLNKEEIFFGDTFGEPLLDLWKIENISN